MEKQIIKTLVVEYTPRGEESRTRKLREHFINLIEDKTKIEFLDLAKNPPQLFDEQMINAYYKRAYHQKDLTDKEKNLLKKSDDLRDQLINSNILVLVSPMYNFGYPATVKAWIDAVMQKGFVYETNHEGHIPKLDHLKVCIIYTSGIVFDQISENTGWNGLEAEGARLFEYMGAEEVRVVHVQGTDMLNERFVDFRTKNVAIKKLNGLAKNWYGADINGLETY